MTQRERTPDPDDSHAITELLRALDRGDGDAHDQLFTKVYSELRRLARLKLGAVPPQATLDTTALVHETYLKLAGDARWSVRDRAHFYALAARAMRQVLVDHARRRGRQKRGDGVVAIPLDDAIVSVPERAMELVALDAALEKLEIADPELARLVEWRFFAGLAIEEIARTWEMSERTVKRRWRTARAFLYQELHAQGVGPRSGS